MIGFAVQRLMGWISKAARERYLANVRPIALLNLVLPELSRAAADGREGHRVGRAGGLRSWHLDSRKRTCSAPFIPKPILQS
jgi:hypothetical protein